MLFKCDCVCALTAALLCYGTSNGTDSTGILSPQDGGRLTFGAPQTLCGDMLIDKIEFDAFLLS